MLGSPVSLLGCASSFAHCPERQTTRWRQLSEEGCCYSDLQLEDRGDMASFLAAEVAAVLGGTDVMWLIHLFADQETEGIWVGSYKTHHLVSDFVHLASPTKIPQSPKIHYHVEISCSNT